jgi:hypothetical protein
MIINSPVPFCSEIGEGLLRLGEEFLDEDISALNERQ